MGAKLESVILEASVHSSPYFIQPRTRSEHRLLGRKTNRTLQQSPLVVSSQLCRRILPKIPEYGPDVWFNADVELIADHHNIITPKGQNNPGTSQEVSPMKSDNPFHSNIYQNWNHMKKRD